MFKLLLSARKRFSRDEIVGLYAWELGMQSVLEDRKAGGLLRLRLEKERS